MGCSGIYNGDDVGERIDAAMTVVAVVGTAKT